MEGKLKAYRSAKTILERKTRHLQSLAGDVAKIKELNEKLQSDIEMAERFNLTMNVLPLGKKKAATPEIETDDGN